MRNGNIGCRAQVDGQASAGGIAGAVGEGVGEGISRTMRAWVEGVDVTAIGIDDECAEFTHDRDNAANGVFAALIAIGTANAGDSGAIGADIVRAANGACTGDDVATGSGTSERD